MKMSDYNGERKKILERLDKEENVENIELGMYELTPYFKDDFDVCLSDAIMLNKNLERKIKHIKNDIYFSPPQADILNKLYKKDRVILSAPTSFGKTLIIKEYIYKKKPENIVYIVPTNALAYELEKSFKSNENFQDYIIFDKCFTKEYEVNKKHKKFFIGTQEKFLEIDKDDFGNIELFVIDEAYKLEETVKKQRAYKLSETFLDSMNISSKKIFLLTPKAKIKGFDKYGFEVLESDFNAVDKNYEIVEEDTFYKMLYKKGYNEKTILFCGSPNKICKVPITSMNIEKDEKIQNFINLMESDIHPDWNIIKLLKSGILTHHGQMPKYIQNKMINIFNTNDKYNILFGTNSISEGINTVTKNLFIHPDYDCSNNKFLLKNTVGRAGRLGEYPIGHIFSIQKINNYVEEEIQISLAISEEEELSELTDSKDEGKILEFSKNENIDFNLCKKILVEHKLSLNKLGKILDALKEDYRFSDVSNLPFIAKKAYDCEYKANLDVDKILIKGYLNYFYINENKKILNNFQNRIDYFKFVQKKSKKMDNSQIINQYMRFIYSTLEYYIMPIVNIGLDVFEINEKYKFGKNVIKSLETCKKKYFKKTYGDLDVDKLTEKHLSIISAMKDYGMLSIVKKLNIELLNEIENQLNIRYSTIDILRAIDYLAEKSSRNKKIFREIKKKYIV